MDFYFCAVHADASGLDYAANSIRQSQERGVGGGGNVREAKMADAEITYLKPAVTDALVRLARQFRNERDEALAEVERLRARVEQLERVAEHHAWQEGFGECMCAPHRALVALEKPP